MQEKIKSSPLYKEELKAAQKKASKPLLYIGIVSMVMVFAGLTSAYVVRADNGNWLLFNLPNAFYLSTAIILTSSITLFFALRMAKKNNFRGVSLAILATFILGILFTVSQFQGWSELVDKKIVFAGKYANASGSFLYVLTGLHLAHLFAGLITLLVTFINSLKKKYTDQNTHGLELCSIFWHFLDILWVYLFLFLYFIR